MKRTETLSRVFPLLEISIFLLTFLMLLNSSAQAASAKVREACKDDYLRFCPSYQPETPKGRQCMRQMGRRLSKHCLDALADAGQVRRSNR